MAEPKTKPAMPGILAAAGWMLIACALFASQSVIVKIIGQRLDPLVMQFFRCFFGFVAIAPFALGPVLRARSLEPVRFTRPWLHFNRALMSYLGMTCGWYAITHMPLADATAISFTRPLFLLLLAVVALGERVGWRRSLATAIGFAGTLIIIRPGADAFSPVAFIALLGAFFIADVSVLVKKLAAAEKTTTIMLTFTTISTLIAIVPAAIFWQTPTWLEIGLLAIIGAMATAGQSAAVRAYRAADASAVAPFDSIRMLFAIVYGWLIFAEVPDRFVLLGAAILIASVIYITQREYRLGRRAATEEGGG
jgi:drug/metabolite transporter (DMT)-like permease